jgi:hypothetical protein
LGHFILVEGIAIDPKKIEAIRGSPKPRNSTEVIYFMRLVGYYRRFIKGFSNISISITYLQKE